MSSKFHTFPLAISALLLVSGCNSIQPATVMSNTSVPPDSGITLTQHQADSVLSAAPAPAGPILAMDGDTSSDGDPASLFDEIGNGNSAEVNFNECNGCKKKEPREALFEWAIGPEQPEEENGDDEEEDTIVTDRPDFTEASKSVGKGRIQIEMGYTYTRDSMDGTTLDGHSYPEMLLRIGMFTEWFELRIGQNFGNERSGLPDQFTTADGAEDLYLGARFDLTEQKGWLPESSIIFQMTVPTGSDAVSTDEVMPGTNLLYSWEVIPDCISMAGSTQVNKALDDSGDFYAAFAQSFTIAYTLTKKVGAYTEWFGIFPVGASDISAGPQQYFNGGFTYLLDNNLQLDIRAGVGLNDRSEDFFTGAGFAYRY